MPYIIILQHLFPEHFHYSIRIDWRLFIFIFCMSFKVEGILALFFYCCSSIVLTLFNKAVLSSANFHMNFLLLSVQV